MLAMREVTEGVTTFYGPVIWKRIKVWRALYRKLCCRNCLLATASYKLSPPRTTPHQAPHEATANTSKWACGYMASVRANQLVQMHCGPVHLARR